jgi:hypothetical protein
MTLVCRVEGGAALGNAGGIDASPLDQVTSQDTLSIALFTAGPRSMFGSPR